MPPHTRRNGELGVGAPTLLPGQKLFSLKGLVRHYQRNVLLCLGFSMSPMLLCRRGLIALTESTPSPRTMIRRGRNHMIPTPPGLTTPIGWHL